MSEFREGHPLPAAVSEATRRLSDHVRVATRRPAVRTGAAAGPIVVAAGGAIILVLSILPVRVLGHMLGVTYPSEQVDIAARISRSVLGPWSGQYTATDHDQLSSASDAIGFTGSGVNLAAALVAVGLLVLAGRYVRGRFAQARDRRDALIACTVTTAVTVALAALTLGYTTTYGEGDATGVIAWSYSWSTYFAAAAGTVVLVGMFSFGVVASLRQPLADAIRTAAVLTAVPFLLLAIAFPLWAATGPQHGAGEPRLSFGDAATSLMGQVGSTTLPLAAGARVDLRSRFGTPLEQLTTSGESVEHRVAYLEYARGHAGARVTDLGRLAGRVWRVVWIVAALLVLAAWAIGGARLVRRHGAPRLVDGLRRGALVGGAGIVFLVFLSWVSHLVGTQGQRSAVVLAVGAGGGAVIQTAVVLLLVTGAGGMLAARLRPAPFAAPPLRVQVPVWAWPARNGRAADRDVVVGAFGAVVGAGIVVAAGLAVKLLSLVPITGLDDMLGTAIWTADDLTDAGAGTSALLAPWNSAMSNIGGGYGIEARFSGALLLPTLIAIGVIAVAGTVAQRPLAATLRERAIALGGAAVGGALLVALAAQLVDDNATRRAFSAVDYPALRLAASTALVIGMAGLLSFGVFGLLAAHWRLRIKLAALAYGIPFAVAAVAVVVAMTLAPAVDDPVERQANPTVHSMRFSAALGGSLLPSALGAPVNLTTDPDFSWSPVLLPSRPDDSGSTDEDSGDGKPTGGVVNARLVAYSGANPTGNLVDYGDVLGGPWKPLAIVICLMLVGLWAAVGAIAARAAGVHAVSRAALAGAWVGAIGGILSACVAWLTRSTVDLGFAGRSYPGAAWGPGAGASVQTAAELIILCAAGGAIWAIATRSLEADAPASPAPAPTDG